MAGAAGAWVVATVLPRWFEAAQPDLSLIAWSAALLVVAAVVAMIPPTRRALKLDPLDAMRA